MPLSDDMPIDFYLFKVKGNWPLYAEPNEHKAISRFETLRGVFGDKVQCWHVLETHTQEMTIKRTVTKLVEIGELDV